MTRVKICGVTSVAEARLAERCGADAIGILVGQIHRASDFVEPDLAREICCSLLPFVTSVLVTHIEDPDEILRLAESVPASVLQLHSDMSARTLETVRNQLGPRKIMGKVTIRDETAIDRASAISGVVDAVVLDSDDPCTGRVGGTGIVHDWSISAKIVDVLRIPVMLGGGLRPDNIGKAIEIVRPWAVDVNSGVETPEGRKSEELTRQFIRAARTCR